MKMKIKKTNRILFSLFLIVFCVSLVIPMTINVQSANAVVNTEELLNNNIINQSGLPQAELKSLIMRIINIVLGFLGIIAIILIIYAGFLWMTSNGSEEKLKTAKGILINATIGLAIILSAFIIANFILKALLGEETPPSQICTSGICADCHKVCNAEGTEIIYTPGCTDACIPPPLSNFVIKWVDPKDQEKDVALCRAIQAGFSDELNETTVNANNILIKIKDGETEGKICDSNKDCASGKCEANICIGKTVAGIFRTVKEVFQFRSEKDFEENTAYQVEITTNVKSKKNIAISAIDSKRKWVFSAGTLNDTTPPKVIKVYPEDNKLDVCLTAPIESIFNEPMDVISLMDKNGLNISPVVVAGFTHSVNNADTLIANPNEIYQTNKKYAPLLNSNIIADSCGNLLDGNANGTAEKSPNDDYAPPPVGTDPDWSFTTGAQPYCNPEITNITSNGFYDGEVITITGNYFTIAGNAIFNNNVYDDSNCFDGDFYPNTVCVSDWDDKRITLKAPAGAGASNGAINGGVWVKVGELLSNGKEFTVSSPHINWISPEKGGKGQYITLSGANFKTIQGKVYFVKQSDHKIKIEAEFPCLNSWTDNQIIIKIPETIALGEYYLQIKTNDNHFSNINNFIINDDTPGPGICEVKPDCGVVETEVILSGERFGTASDGKIYFGEKIATSTLWTETKIITKAPSGIKQGGNPIKIIVNEKSSNAVGFQSPCEIGNSCDTNLTTPACEIGACSENSLCNFDNCICQLKHCFNGRQDSDKGETGVDCGGIDCDSCGNVGDSCDDNLQAPSCQPKNSLCNVELICRESDCTCQEKGQEGDACDGNFEIVGCQVNDNKCEINNGYTCNSLNCKCTKKPFIESISPENGKAQSPVTTYVTIHGGNFGTTQGSSRVFFNEQETNLACQNWSDTEIVVAAPFGFNENTVAKVKVKTFAGESNDDKVFTVNNIIKPSICSLSPNHGKAGDKIIISGTNFGDFQINDNYKSQVFFDNLETNVNFWSNGNIEVIAPNGIAVSEPKVKVVLKWSGAPQGTPSNEVSFYINPFITGITPDKGPKDTYATIRGGNFGDIPGRITFNGIQANLAPCNGAWSDNQIIVLAPTSTTGPVIVEKTLPNDVIIQSNNDKIFTYNNEPLAPGICEISPTSGSVGDLVRIEGSNFGETALVNEGVFFNQVKANVSLSNPDNWTNSQINSNVPQTISGDATVTKIGQRDTGKKECVGGIYILFVCIGGVEQKIYEEVVLKSNPVWFEVISPVCGNDRKEETEICDGTDLDNKTCSDFGLTGNDLKCKIDCSGFDTNQCNGLPGICGNEIINPGETCDGDNLNGNTCSDFDSYKAGILICKNDCQFDFFSCKECALNSDCFSNCCKENQCADFNQCQISPNPFIEEWKPQGNDVCINKEISAIFNQLMNKETLNNSAIFLTKNESAVEGNIIVRDEENKTTTFFSPKNYLEKNSEYKMTIIGGNNGVKNRDGLTMENNKTWTFKTGSALCQIDHIKITINNEEKNNDLFTCADDNCVDDQDKTPPSPMPGNQHIYIAQAQDKNNESISANYIWDKIDENAILTMTNLGIQPPPTHTKIITSQRKNGEAIVMVQANATDSPSKATQIKTTVFLCENPWKIGNFPTENVLRDKETGFELFYCRDR